VGSPSVFRLTLKPCSQGLGGLLDASLHDGPLCHWLKGDLGVLAPEASQHMLRHRLCQGTALCLHLLVDDLLQLQYLGSSRAK
jgi:hypothetical protein